MPERDANQLASDVRAGFLTGSFDGLTGDQQATAQRGYEALDELVALVGTLQQERDMARAGRDQWQRDAEGRGVVMYELLARAEAAEAALATTRQALAERDEAIAAALTSLATGPAKDGYAYQVLSAYAPGVT